MHKVLLTLLLAAVVSAQKPPPATTPTGSISGTVRDAGTGTPIPRAPVYANRNSREPQTTTTDEQGRFTFAHAPLAGGDVIVTDEASAVLGSAPIGTGEVRITVPP